MSKLKKIFKKEVIDFFIKSEKFEDERLMNAVIYYQDLLNLFCEMLECEYSPFEQDKAKATLCEEKFTTIQDDIIAQYKIILDYLDVHNAKNYIIFQLFDRFINNLITLMLDSSKMLLIGDLPFLPIGRDEFEHFFKRIMGANFAKFLANLKDLNIPCIKLDNFNLLNSFDLYDSITKIEDIQYISDEKVVEYFKSVLSILKPYSIKRQPIMQEVFKGYSFLRTSGKLVESIRAIAKLSKTDLYPSGIYFELKKRNDVRNIFANHTEYNIYTQYLSSWKHKFHPLSPLGLHSPMFPPTNNIFDNLVNYLHKDSLKAEPNFLISRMRGKY